MRTLCKKICKVACWWSRNGLDVRSRGDSRGLQGRREGPLSRTARGAVSGSTFMREWASPESVSDVFFAVLSVEWQVKRPVFAGVVKFVIMNPLSNPSEDQSINTAQNSQQQTNSHVASFDLLLPFTVFKLTPCQPLLWSFVALHGV